MFLYPQTKNPSEEGFAMVPMLNYRQPNTFCKFGLPVTLHATPHVTLLALKDGVKVTVVPAGIAVLICPNVARIVPAVMVIVVTSAVYVGAADKPIEVHPDPERVATLPESLYAVTIPSLIGSTKLTALDSFALTV